MRTKLPLLVSVMLLTLFAVSSGVSAAQPVKITFWHAMGGTLGKVVEQLVDRFNATHPDIQVEAVFRGSYPEVLNAAVAAARTGAAPNVVQIYEVGTRAALDSGVFIPLEDLLKPGEADWSDFVDAVINYYTVGGKVNSMPFNSSSAILYINATLFRKAGLNPDDPPETFGEVIEVSRRLVQSGVVRAAITWPLHTWFVEQWMAEQGAPLVNNGNGRQARPTEIYTESQAMKRIFAWWKQLYDAGLWINPGVENWDQANAYFVSQQVAMLITSTSDVSFLTEAGKEHGFEVRTAMLPVPDGVARFGVVPGGASLWITRNKPARELEAAKTFVMWLAEPEQQVFWHKNTGYFPVRKSAVKLLEQQGWFKTNPNFRVALDQVLQTRRDVATQGALIGRFQEVRTILEEAFQEVMGGASIDTALAKADKRIEQSFADYNSLFK